MGMDNLHYFYHHVRAALGDPHEFHAIVVHLPIAIGLLGVLFAVLVAITGGASRGIRWACVLLFALGAGGAYLAQWAGGRAADHIMAARPTMLSDAAQRMLDDHQEYGEKVWIFMAVAAVLACATAFKHRGAKVVAIILLLAASVFAAGWVACTADRGGTLVYEYGVGVPQTLNNMPATAHP
jgi:uncharacterized membrane protein